MIRSLQETYGVKIDINDDGSVYVACVDIEAGKTLIVKLVTENGTIIGTKSIFLLPRPDGKHIPFSVEFPLSVTQAHDVRLIISQDGEHIPGVIALSSVDFTIKP